MTKRLGLFGGTFDPIHTGHLLIAQMALEHCQLDEVLFIPSARPPHKTDRSLIAFEHRLAMTSLAVAGSKSFAVSDVEQRFSDLSYTIQTLRWIQSHRPDCSFYLIIGSDSLLALPTWKQPEELVQRAELIVYRRLEYDPAQAEKRFLEKAHLIDHPIIDVSSTWVRDRIQDGLSIRYLVPEHVEEYLIRHQLYNKT
ncbi:MAG: nicotinate-nucleotide adenylyltransferase [Bacteroidetes bacterium]|nr:nicotinate-nucleotide adenylyltransferase [Bacteroidota bacterium]